MIKVRLNKPEDRAYIASSLYKYLLARNNFLPIDSTFNPYFDMLMESHSIKVIYDTTVPDVIMGYIIYKTISDKNINIHFLYTRFSFRKCGIATILLDAVTSDFDRFTFLMTTPKLDNYIEKIRNNINEGKNINLSPKLTTRYKLVDKAHKTVLSSNTVDFSESKPNNCNNNNIPPKPL
jgi:predicted GNAT family acetyltransferase